MKLSNLSHENVVEILMNLPAEKKGYSFLFVEGRDDRRFWNRYKVDKCEVFAAGDQERVIETLRKKHMRRDLRRRVAGIVDADYELIYPTGLLLADDLLYDCHMPDLENIVVSQETLRNVVRKSGVFNSHNEADIFAENWLKTGLHLSIDYGYFRLVARKQGRYRLVPNSIEGFYSDYIDFSSLRLNLKESAALLLKGSPNARISDTVLLQEVEVVKDRHSRSRKLVRGKDLLSFLLCVCMPVFEKTHDHLATRTKLQDWLQVVPDRYELFKRLQYQYKSEDLKKSNIYDCIGHWERASKRYKIVGADI